MLRLIAWPLCSAPGAGGSSLRAGEENLILLLPVLCWGGELGQDLWGDSGVQNHLAALRVVLQPYFVNQTKLLTCVKPSQRVPKIILP